MTILMTQDTDPISELAAMQKVAEALADLSPESVGRVLSWAASAFNAESGSVRLGHVGVPEGHKSSSADQEEDAVPDNEFSSLAELFECAEPRTEAERVLVASYWFQVHEEQSDVDAYSINTELKHLGHGAGNITRAFAKLISSKPSFAMQVRKSGSSQQARKRYRVTNEGKKAVQRMLDGAPD